MANSDKRKNGLINIIINDLLNSFFKGNSLAALLFGSIVVFIKSLSYIRYSGGHTVNIFEGFLLNFSSKIDVMFILIPTLLLFIDAPFIDDYSFLSVYRIKRKKWFYSKYIYIILKTIIFNILLLLVSMLPLVTMGYIENKWSQTFLRIMNGHTNRMEEYNISSPKVSIGTLTPVKTVIITVVLFSLYIIFISEIIFTFNMVFKRKYIGTVVVGLIYIIKTILDRQSFMFPQIDKISFIRNAIFPMGYQPELSGYGFSILYMILLNYIVYIFASTLYPFADFEESNNEN